MIRNQYTRKKIEANLDAFFVTWDIIQLQKITGLRIYTWKKERVDVT